MVQRQVRGRIGARAELHNPRVQAALCYAVPAVVACWLLWRERTNRFVRIHAAQALLFSVAVAFAHVALFALLVVLGNLPLALPAAVALAVVFFVLLLVLDGVALVTWLRALADCMDGRVRRLPLLHGPAERLERLTRRPQSASVSRQPAKNRLA